MKATREDSVMTSIRELQQMEDERLREGARRAATERAAMAARLEAARLEAEREAAARVEALESERRAAEHRRAELERAARERREAREVEIRAEAEATRALRALRLADEHARAMAAIALERRRGVTVAQAIALACGAVALTAAAGWFGVYRPQQRAHAAGMAAMAERTQFAQRDRDRAGREAETLAARLRDAARVVVPSAPSAVVAPALPPAARASTHATPRVRAAVAPTTEAPVDLDLDAPGDPFAQDDVARRGRPARH